MSNTSKFPIDPKCLAQVRDEAMLAAKKNPRYTTIAVLADEILHSYGSASELKELQKKKLKVGF